MFEKDFFDLTKEKKIRDLPRAPEEKQVIVAGCETDVCVLQSCLGLLGLGYEVYVVEDLLFSSARNVESAIARMKAEGAVFLTYKTLYYELIEAVDGGAACREDAQDVRAFPRRPSRLRGVMPGERRRSFTIGADNPRTHTRADSAAELPRCRGRRSGRKSRPDGAPGWRS